MLKLKTHYKLVSGYRARFMSFKLFRIIASLFGLIGLYSHRLNNLEKCNPFCIFNDYCLTNRAEIATFKLVASAIY